MTEKDYFYVSSFIFDSVEAKLIKYQPNGDSTIVLAYALANIRARKVLRDEFGNLAVLTDGGTFPEGEVRERLSEIGADFPADTLHAGLLLLSEYNLLRFFAYDESETEVEVR